MKMLPRATNRFGRTATRLSLAGLSKLSLYFLAITLAALAEGASETRQIDKTVQEQELQHQASLGRISVLYQLTAPEQQKFLDLLKTQLKLKMPGYDIEFVDTALMTKLNLEQQLRDTDRCTLSIGPAATQKALSIRNPVNHFSILVSRNLLDRLHRVYARLGIFVTGIYEEQPIYRQISLARALNRELKEVSLLLDQSDKYYLSEFQAEVKSHGLKLNYRILKHTDSPEKYISEVANENSFLLVQNNSQLFMQSKFAAVVLSAYYKQIRLIGSRWQDAKIGTLASIYTSPTTLAIETSGELKKACSEGIRAKPRYANSFSVIVNQQIANNLNLKNINHNQLSRRVTQLEQDRTSNE